MPYVFHAYRKLTNRYVPEYSHLDESEPLHARIKTVFGKKQWDSDEYDAGYTRYIYVTTSRPMTYGEMRDALCYFDRGCACEHDCCGHFSGGAYTHKLRGNKRGTRWTVPLHYSPNL